MNVSKVVYILLFCCVGSIISEYINNHNREKLVKLKAYSYRRFDKMIRFLENKEYDIWSENRYKGEVEVIVPCARFRMVRRFARRNKIRFTILYNNLKTEIEHSVQQNEEKCHEEQDKEPETCPNHIRRKAKNILDEAIKTVENITKERDPEIGHSFEEQSRQDFDGYRTASMNYLVYNTYSTKKGTSQDVDVKNQILTEVIFLASKHPEKVKFCPVGKSFENRLLYYVKVSDDVEPCDTDTKPIIFLDSAMHGREWISPATNLFIMKKFIDTDDGVAEDLLEEYTFYFVPVFNPDGYDYTFTTDRLWRKTRSRNWNSNDCVGVDPNRNWKREFGGVGSSNDSCSMVYSGPEPESERCVSAFANLLREKKDLLIAYFSLHSFNQLLLVPKSYTKTLPKSFGEIIKFGLTFVKEIRERFGSFYIPGPAPILMSPLSGLASDYVNEDLGVVHSYIIELRDKGEKGFILGPEEIEPSGLETFDALVKALSGIKKLDDKK